MSRRTSAVLVAVANGDSGLLRMALQRRRTSLPAAGDNSELSDALYEAVHRKHADCVRLLLEAGADPGVASSRSERLAIFRAAQDENWPLVELLAALPAARPPREGQQQQPPPTATPRRTSCCAGAAENGSTVLHWACRRGAPRSTLQLLIAAGCDVNARTKEGLTPLMLAVQHRSYAAVDALLAAGCAVDARNGRGQTALMMAACSGFCAAQLLAAGAEAALADDAGNTALIAAASEGLCTVVQQICTVLAACADGGRAAAAAAVDARNTAGLAAIHIAATKGHAECAEAIVEAGGDPALEDAEGGTAAYYAAAGSGSEEVLAYLVRVTPAFGDRLSRASKCPLRRAAESGHSAALAVLLLVSSDALAAAAALQVWRRRRQQQQQQEVAAASAPSADGRVEQLLEDCVEYVARRVPRDLKSLSRDRIRRCLGRAVLPRNVRLLPLPAAVRDYVAMRNVDRW